MVVAYLAINGLPALIASIPGFWLLSRRRWALGVLQIMGAIVVTFPLAIMADRARTRELSDAGVIVDDLSFLLRPWLYGIAYFVVTAFLIALITAVLRGRRMSSNVEQ